MTINLFGDWGPRTQRTRTIHTHTLLLPHKCLYFSRWNGPVSQNAVIIYMLMNQKKLRYGVIGTGAIGGYYGGKLAHHGLDVHFLFHSDYDHVVEHGLQVDSCDGSFHLDHVNAYHRAADMPACDVVLVSLKSVNNGLLAQLLPPLLKPDTLVVLIQNGIGVEEDVQKMMPDLRLAAGLAYICAAKTEPGRVDHQCYGRISLGNYSCPDEERLTSVADDFVAAGIKANVVEYREARWKKAVWNMTYNGMSVVLNAQTDQLMENEDTERLIHRQMLEIIHAAQAMGVSNINDDYAEAMLSMTHKMEPYSPSMKLDYDFHRPMEINYLYTRPIEEARRAGVSMPMMEMLEAELLFLDKRNQR